MPADCRIECRFCGIQPLRKGLSWTARRFARPVGGVFAPTNKRKIRVVA